MPARPARSRARGNASAHTSAAPPRSQSPAIPPRELHRTSSPGLDWTQHSPCLCSLMLARVQQVNERKHEHPDQINEMPVKSGRFDVARIQPASSIELRYYSDCDHAAYDVQQMQARDAEKGGAKKRIPAEGVVAPGHSLR